jgi:hypothetical protein
VPRTFCGTTHLHDSVKIKPLNPERKSLLKDNPPVVLGLENPMFPESLDNMKSIFEKLDGDIVAVVYVPLHYATHNPRTGN